jgi:shikimate dehydrogenase
MTDASTIVCCLFGDPVEFSLSPLVHNHGYEVAGLNFVYVAFRVKDIKLGIDSIRELGIRGVSVTMPHKVNAMKYIDNVDNTAQEIGAINTIINDKGVLSGFNTDYSAALKALGEKTTLKGKKTVLLGGGGVGLAIATALKRNDNHLTIIDIIREKAEELARLVGAERSGGLELLSEINSADILINATPVGMLPSINESAVPRELLHQKLTVFDAIYHPRETKLISEAKEAGCTIVYGYKMFLYQAVIQFEFFTGHQAPVLDMEQVLIKALEGEKHASSTHSR